jgi:hypothetical protein
MAEHATEALAEGTATVTPVSRRESAKALSRDDNAGMLEFVLPLSETREQSVRMKRLDSKGAIEADKLHMKSDERKPRGL